MYFVWKPDTIRRGGVVIRGELRPFREDWYTIPCFSPDPIRHLFPQLLEFDVTGGRRGLPDHLLATGFEPCSPDLLSLIVETGVEYEAVPARLYDRRSGALLSADYQYVHLLGWLEVVDLDRSLGNVRLDGQGRLMLREIRRLVLREEITARAIGMLRPAEASQLILVHDTFKRAFESRGLWGSRFIPVEEFQTV